MREKTSLGYERGGKLCCYFSSLSTTRGRLLLASLITHINHIKSITHIITTRENWSHLFRWRKRALVNFLSFACLCSKLGVRKDTYHDPVPECVVGLISFLW